MMQAVGLSVGGTSLTAVTAEAAVVRTPMLTFVDGHAPMVGLPGENRLAGGDGRGLAIADFVERVGDPVGVLAADGSSHRGENLVAEALRALTYLATGQRPWPETTAVTYPAHWRPQAVAALQWALGRVPEWSHAPIPMVSEVAAAVTALQREPGLPTHGVLAVCDFGGSGTSITLVDAGNGYRPIGATVRHLDFSGDLIDQALLTHVIGTLAHTGAVDLAATSAIGSLSALRLGCRGAKERLSASTVTALPVELPGYRGDVRLTRTELDDLLRAPLAGVLGAIDDTLRRNGIRTTDLVAVATVGGAAATVAVTTTLSESLRIPVITSPRPGLTAATGAALRALRGPADDSATTMAPAPAIVRPPEPAAPSLAWSQADDIPEPVPQHVFGSGVTGARPQIDFLEDPHAADEGARVPWYRRPTLVMAAAAVGVLAAVGGIGIALTTDSTETTASTPEPTVPPAVEAVPAPEPLAVQPPAPAPQVQHPPAPPTRTVTAAPAPVTRTQVVRAPAPAPAAPPTTTPPPPPTTTTPPPTTTTPPPTTTTPPPTTTTPPPPVTETVTETVQPSPEPEPPVAEPEPEAPAPEPEPPVAETPQWTLPPLPTIPGLPPFLPQPVDP